MLRTLTIVAALVLVLHGLIHLLGTAVYMRFATLEEMPFKTTLLGGAWEIGEGGMRLYGALWGVAALGFLAAAAIWLAGLGGWQSGLLAVTLFSLMLTVLDYDVAFMGVAINLAILALLAAAPRLVPAAVPG